MDYSVIFTQGNIFLLFSVAFMGGVVASLSPCSLAMLPIIIGYVGGYSNLKPIKTLVQMLAFVFGASIVFTAIGLICALTGKAFASNPYFVLFVASFLMIMGLKLIGFLDFDMPVIVKQMPKENSFNMFLYPIILGCAFALAGSPCSTPILAGIMGIASLSANIITATVMLFLFSLGQGIIFLVAGLLTAKLKTWKNFYKISDIIMEICGWLLIFGSLYIFYKIFTPFLVN